MIERSVIQSVGLQLAPVADCPIHDPAGRDHHHVGWHAVSNWCAPNESHDARDGIYRDLAGGLARFGAHIHRVARGRQLDGRGGRLCVGGGGSTTADVGAGGEAINTVLVVTGVLPRS